MKNLVKSILTVAILSIASFANAQTMNWASLKYEQNHIINTRVGMEYGLNYGVGYGYHIKTKYIPIIANIEHTMPAGGKLADDFKSKIGGQIRWINFYNFQLSTKVNGVFRRYENDFARLSNFGSDLSAIVGYYRPKWFVAAEIGFDKAIVTHFKISEKYKTLFSKAVDGWYEPPTGGNVYYGLQAGFSYKIHDIYVKAGKIVNEDFKTKPVIPFYGELGYNVKF